MPTTNEPKLSPQQEREHDLAIAKALDKNATSGCYVCEKKLFMSFFFDAEGHDAIAEEGTEQLTNLGKLYEAHTPEVKGIYRFYAQGLGKKFELSKTARNDMLKEKAGELAKDNVKDLAKDPFKEAGKEAAKKTVEKMMQGATVAQAVKGLDWKEIGKGAAKGATQSIKPMALAKGAGLSVAAGAGKGVVEALPDYRDNKFSEQAYFGGLKSRLLEAIEFFESNVNAQTQPVKEIRIAVFGADLGAAIARAFVNNLTKDKLTGSPEDLQYILPNGNIAQVKFVFMGLFDCVSAKMDSISNWVAGLALGVLNFRIDEPMGIPPSVEKVLHLYAAHEQYPQKRLDSVMKGKGQKMQEIPYPGVQCDVVGGALPNEQGRSNQAARVPLRHMFGEAYAAGVPLLKFEKIRQKTPNLHRLFNITDSLKQGATGEADLESSLTQISNELKAVGDAKKVVETGMLERLQWTATRTKMAATGGASAISITQMGIVQHQARDIADYHQSSDLGKKFASLFQFAALLEWLSFYKSNANPYTPLLCAFDQVLHDSFPKSAIPNFLYGYMTSRAVDHSKDVEKPKAEEVEVPMFTIN